VVRNLLKIALKEKPRCCGASYILITLFNLQIVAVTDIVQATHCRATITGTVVVIAQIGAACTECTLGTRRAVADLCIHPGKVRQRSTDEGAFIVVIVLPFGHHIKADVFVTDIIVSKPDIIPVFRCIEEGNITRGYIPEFIGEEVTIYHIILIGLVFYSNSPAA
jgi:hypothetical protein